MLKDHIWSLRSNDSLDKSGIIPAGSKLLPDSPVIHLGFKELLLSWIESIWFSQNVFKGVVVVFKMLLDNFIAIFELNRVDYP